MIKQGALKENFDDPRDYVYERVCGAINKGFPTRYMIPEDNMGTQKNQGNIGACVAETIAQIAEEWWKRQLGKREEHSEGYIYGELRNEDYLGCGMYPSIAMKYWMEKGTVPKTFFDILIEMPGMRDALKDRHDLSEIAKRYKLSGFVKLKGSDRDLQVKDALMKYEYGLVSAGGGHCMQLVGWDDDTNRYICRDSYGYSKDGGNGYKEKRKDSIEEIYLPLFEPIKLPFTDIPDDAWYLNDVKNLHFAGLMNGTSATTFEPNRPITRAEYAAGLNRLYSDVVKMIRANSINTTKKIKILEDKVL